MGAEIPDGLLYGLAPVTFLLVVGLLAFIVRTLWNTTLIQREHGLRLTQLERHAGIMVPIRQDQGIDGL